MKQKIVVIQIVILVSMFVQVSKTRKEDTETALFFWWNGATLPRARLTEQLDILNESSADGFAVSYFQTDPKGADFELNKK